MPRQNADQKIGLLWAMPVALIFFLGGFVQYVGALSQTQSNWVAILLLSHVFFKVEAWRQSRSETLLFIFLIYILFMYLQRQGPFSYTATYIYYIVCTAVAAIAGRVYALRLDNRLDEYSYVKMIKAFLILELIVVAIQALFTEEFVNFSRAPIGYIDAIFGTFFLQSDAALAAVCELLIISVFLLNIKPKDKFFVTLLASAIIFFGNSNTAKSALLVILALLYTYSAYRQLRVGRYAFNSLLFVCIACILIGTLSSISSELNSFVSQATSDYYHRESWESASRFSPIGQIFEEGLSLFGNGALTYYNPITKQWLYNAGFSTFYSLYIDFGLFGLLLYYAYQFFIIVKFTKNYYEFMIMFCVFISFSTLNFALTDLSFVFSFNLILRLTYMREDPPYERLVTPNDESR